MPAGVVRTQSDEHHWNAAKRAADKSYKRTDKNYWAVVMDIYKKIKRAHKRNLKKMRKSPMPAMRHQGPY